MKTKPLIVGGILLFLAAGGWFLFRPGQHFDASLWRKSATPESVRIRMADELVSSQRLIGLTKQQVETLLGEPDKTISFSEYELTYYLGVERGLSMESKYLLLKFDSEGRVKIATIARGY